MQTDIQNKKEVMNDLETGMGIPARQKEKGESVPIRRRLGFQPTSTMLNLFVQKQKVPAAFYRNATVIISKVSISRIRNTVMLTGKVRSLTQSNDTGMLPGKRRAQTIMNAN